MLTKIITVAGMLAVTSLFGSAQANDNGFLNCTAENCEESVREMGKFARRGSPEANYIMATLYLFGEYVEKDEEKARAYYQRAAEFGFHQAYYMLSKIYQQGLGVETNPELAVKYLQKAADGRSSDAEYELAIRLLQGDGVQKDISAAIEYLDQASQKRHADANFLLGKILINGYESIPADPEQGLEKLTFAARQGNQLARQLLQEMRPNSRTKAGKELERKLPEEGVEVITVTAQPTNLEEYLGWYADIIKTQKIYDGRSVFRTGHACTRGSGCSISGGIAIEGSVPTLGAGGGSPGASGPTN